MRRWLAPFGAFIGVVAILILPLMQRQSGEYQWALLGQIPVLHEGRVKPLDTVARAELLALRGKQVVRTPDRTYLPMDWLAEVVVHPEKADTLPLVAIGNSEILGMLGQKTESKPTLTFKDLVPYLDKIESEAAAAEQTESKARSRYERDIIGLKSKLVAYTQLKNTFRPEGVPDFQLYTQRYVDNVPNARVQLMAHSDQPQSDAETVQSLSEIMLYFKQLHYISRASLVRVCPPLDGGANWMTLGDGYLILLKNPQPHPAAPLITAAFGAYEHGNSASFNAALAAYHDVLEHSHFEGMTKIKVEYYFTQSQIFYGLMIVYVLVVLGTFTGWLLDREWLLRWMFWITTWGFGFHTIAIGVRMWIEGRPPVTNLYTSSVFVGWVAILLGIVLERLYRYGIGTMVSGMIGFSTLIVAHHLSLQGDTMQMMQAVLDSNFWLSTHVVTICIGYGATFLAGFLAIIYVFRGVFTRRFDEVTRSNLIRMIYAIICFALLFSFVGTVLGGIWADQSWGRFWGWDPKENGAMIIVLWNAAILHSRWGGIIRDRGLVAMALFGNIVTSFSWFGVNMLGVGLHSYGFMDQAFIGLMAFIFSQLVVIWLVYLPARYWRSLK